MATVKAGSVLRFNRIRHKRRDGKHYVGCDSCYIEMDDNGWKAFQLLRSGRKVSEAGRSMPGYDVLSFAHMLCSSGFVKGVDGKELKKKRQSLLELSFFTSPLAKRLSRLLFSPIAYFVYALMIALAASIVRNNPSYIVGSEDFVFVDSLALFLPLSFLVTWLLVLLHEFAHYIAGLSLGINPKFGLANRLFYVVAFTELDSLHEVEPRMRDRAYLAGMVVDLLIISWAIIVMDSDPLGLFAIGSALARLLRFVVLVEVLGLIWQFLFFLRTDLYYYFANTIEVDDLHPRAMQLIDALWRSVRKFSLPHPSWYRNLSSHTSIGFYALTFVLGVTLNTAVFMLFEFPITISLVVRAVSGIVSGAGGGNMMLFADSAVFLLISGFNFSLLGIAIVASGEHKKGIAHLLHYAKVLLQPVHAVMKLSGK